MNKRCVIVANGKFPTGDEALRILCEADYVCCCDGAVDKLIGAGMTPDAIVGDGDSISKDLKTRFSNIFVHVSEQDSNDLTKATKYCIEQGFRDIAYIGATGLRDDHTIGNVFLLADYLEKFGISAAMVTDEGAFIAYSGKNIIKSYSGQQVSVFNVDCSRMQSRGLRWAISAFNRLWQGTLNESIGDEFEIDADGLYIVFQER